MFMRETQYGHLAPSDQERGVAQPPLQALWGTGEPIELPDPGSVLLAQPGLREAVESRSSLRSFAQEPLALGELAYLLWCTQGVKRVIPGRATFRTVPSAGARHPFETIVLVNRVDGLQAGLYQYASLEHQLVPVAADPEIADKLAAACYGQQMVKASAATFFWVAERYRMTWRYGERGIRYIHLDAGHVCQNLYLAAESIGCGACAIAAFYDEQVNPLLGLDGEDRFVVYLAPVGKRRQMAGGEEAS